DDGAAPGRARVLRHGARARSRGRDARGRAQEARRGDRRRDGDGRRVRPRAHVPAVIGGALVRGGLTPRALAAWAGTDRLSALPALVPRLAAREVTPAAGVLALLVAGVEVPVAKLGAIEFSLEPLARLGILELAGGVALARVAVLPVGGSV